MPATPRPQTLLVIDDAQEIHDLVDVRLRHEPLTILHALDGGEGLRMAQKAQPDVILLDLNLPGTTGLDVCRTLKADETLAAVPIIFLTGATDVDIKGRAFDLGACDYVTKPFEPVELRARVRSALRIRRMTKLLTEKAQIDDLTGLWNRAGFDRRLETRLAEAATQRQPLSVLVCRLDGLGALTDSYGRPFRDQVVTQAADALDALQPCPDGVCRYDHDSFGLVLPHTSGEVATTLGRHLRQVIAGLSFQALRTPVTVTASIGIATQAPLGQLSPAALLHGAEQALAAATAAGGDQVRQAGQSQ